jgi:predicted P-loop ATPase/GTPase
MLILVNGLMAYQAGKTTLVRAILLRAREAGDDFVAMKPRSAHNYWEHYDHSRAVQDMGLLVSLDAITLHALSRDPPDVSLLNPYHQMVCPLDPLRLKEEEEHMLGDTEDGILAERLTDARGHSTLFVNRRSHLFVAPPEFLDTLAEKADQTTPFHSSPVAEGLAFVNEPIREVFEAVSAKHEHVLLESQSDTIWPLRLEPEEVDLMISVGGGAGFLVDPQDVAKAQEVVGGRTMAGLLRYVKPMRSFRMPQLSSQERNDEARLQEAYASVLEVLWKAG